MRGLSAAIARLATVTRPGSKKPPGHDSVRPHTRLPVSQFRRCPW